jgi:ABC-2 type transport system ATP-binding protein
VAAIEAEGLVKVYRSEKNEVRALDGVDLAVRAGTALALLGRKGAGKTTTIRILTTLLRPDAGSARVAGLDVVRHAHAVRRRIGLPGREAAIDESLTGREHLSLLGRQHQLGRDEALRRADALVERLDLAEAADRAASTYSSGMRRRLDLAGALIGESRLLFLDEPTIGLDARSRLAAWHAIRTQVREGATLLLATQDPAEADALADEIAVLDRGRIVVRGTPEELGPQLAREQPAEENAEAAA